MITSRTRAVVLLGAAFLLGLTAGGAGIAMAARSGKVHLDGRGPGDRGDSRGGWMSELDLSTEQRDSVQAAYRLRECGMDSVFKRIRPQTDSLYETIRADVEARRELTRNHIRALLAPTQQERYDSIVRSDDENRRRQRDGRPSPCDRSTEPSGGPRGNK